MVEQVIVDAVVHPYDLGPSNRDPATLEQLLALHPFHLLCSGPQAGGYALSAEEFLVDFDPEAMAHALFAESAVDLAIIHALPNLGFTKAGITDVGRMAALRDRYPGRFLLYGTVDTPVTDTAIKQLEDQVDRYGLDGLKLYPAFFYDGGGHAWRLDDANFAFPLLEAVQDLGLRNVAIHKTIPVPPAPEDAFNVSDMGGALARFPGINFHMVHAGVAFIPETARLLREHPNLHCNLESTFSYILSKPRRFAETITTLIEAAGPDRLLFGSGVNLVHPRRLLDAFEAFEMPDDLPPLTPEVRAKILGGNALAAHRLDPVEVTKGSAGDHFDQLRSDGLQPPWSYLRS